MIRRTEATMSLLNTILFLEREVEINAFKSSIENRVLASFYKADYKTARNLLRKLIDNLYYLMQISFQNNPSIKVQRKSGLRIHDSGWQLAGGKETTTGFSETQRRHSHLSTCVYYIAGNQCMKRGKGARTWAVCMCVCYWRKA